MDNKKYKIVGLLDLFGNIPGSLEPVFIDEEGKLYLGICRVYPSHETNCFFQEFEEIPKKYYERVKYLSKLNVETDTILDEYSVGDLAICCMLIDYNHVYIGRIDKYLEFLKKYKEDFAANSNATYKEDFLKELQEEIEEVNEFVDDAKKKCALDEDIQFRKTI